PILPDIQRASVYAARRRRPMEQWLRRARVDEEGFGCGTAAHPIREGSEAAEASGFERGGAVAGGAAGVGGDARAGRDRQGGDKLGGVLAEPGVDVDVQPPAVA